MKIVGESHYQETLESIAGPKDAEPHWRPVEIQLKREPTNPYDPNAVQCLIDGKLVGYIDREDTLHLQDLLRRCEEQGQKTTVPGCIVGGWKHEDGDEGSFGVSMGSPEGPG